MTTWRQITVLPARGCAGSRTLLEYLQTRNIPFTRLDPESPEGQALAA